MPKVTFISFDGTERQIDAGSGLSLMQAAVSAGIEEIVAECGGACSCATCHVYVDPAWFEAVGEAQDMEKDMLEFVMEQQATSRLSCQIKLSEQLDGLVVRLPESQF